jgi:ribosomal protein S18 acetylase RimI-like enzyme
MLFVYKIHHVPTNDPVLSAFLAGKLAALRLQALTVSPAAFGGEFVLEIFSEMPYTLWIERLQRRNVHTFIAVAYPEGTTEEEQTVDRGNIVGTATLSKSAGVTIVLSSLENVGWLTSTQVGPVPKREYKLASLNGLELGEDDKESKWHCTALYCSPEVRGKGVGRMLVNGRIEFARAESMTEKIRIRVLVHPHNAKVLKPLKARGFVARGKCTPVEAISAACDAMLLPPGRGARNPELLHGPTIFVMELETTNRTGAVEDE